MSKSTERGNIGLAGILLIIFITLKLVGVIAWSWWWVLSPIWLPAAIFVAFLLVMAILAALFEMK
ncbi:hypothetical protein IID24_03195 [Patescibacteria group bacterium]|nr:hypothetical protein [Patescibacteria group bacterium]